MAVVELAIRRLGVAGKKRRKSFSERESWKVGSLVLEREQEWKSKADCARRLKRCVDRGVDRLFLRSLDWL
jgi:hypothetical protein